MKNLHFSDLQTKIIARGAGVSVEHYNAQGKLPICTVYWRRMIFKNREQPIVARGNDWWQLPTHPVPVELSWWARLRAWLYRLGIW